MLSIQKTEVQKQKDRLENPPEKVEELQEELPEKPVTMAIQEVARGELTASLKEDYCN